MKLTTITILTVAAAAFTFSTSAAPKGAELLIQRAAPSFAADYKPMSCPKCINVSVVVPVTADKGSVALAVGGASTRTIATHQCGACVDVTASTGAGKHAPMTTSHKCTVASVDKLACCTTTK